MKLSFEENVIPHDVVIVDAILRKPLLPEHAGNDFINALPPGIFDQEQFAEAFCSLPAFSKKERMLPPSQRVPAIGRLSSFVELFTQHFDVLDTVTRVLVQGYIHRSPSDTVQERVKQHYKLSMEGRLVPLTKPLSGHAEWFGIFGVSGTGKTVTMNRTLSFLPQVVRHPIDRITRGSNLQVVWLKVDCPPDGSLKQLCRWILQEYDRILGEKYSKQVGTRATEDELLNAVSSVAKHHHTGIIVVDEVQNVSNAIRRSKGSAMDFFVSFSNVVRIPVCTIGTPKALKLFEKAFSTARRVCDQGSIIFRNIPNDEEWRMFVDSLFEYQWVKKPADAEKFYEHLYDLTQGVVAMVIRLFQMAQISAIKKGHEEITGALLTKVQRERFSPMHPMLKAIKSNNRRQIERYEDLLEETLAQAKKTVEKEGKLAQVKDAAKVRKQNATELSAVSTLISLDISEKVATEAVAAALFDRPDCTVAKAVELALNLISAEDKAPPTAPPDSVPLQQILREGKESGKAVKDTLRDKGMLSLEAKGKRL